MWVADRHGKTRGDLLLNQGLHALAKAMSAEALKSSSLDSEALPPGGGARHQEFCKEGLMGCVGTIEDSRAGSDLWVGTRAHGRITGRTSSGRFQVLPRPSPAFWQPLQDGEPSLVTPHFTICELPAVTCM